MPPPQRPEGGEIRSVPMEMFNYCTPQDNQARVHGYGGPGEGRHPCVGRVNNGPQGNQDDCTRPAHRPISVRRAWVTQIVAACVCGVVCVMMVVAATYGCIYASLMAKYQKEMKKRAAAYGVRGETDAEDGPCILSPMSGISGLNSPAP
ncbi:hypothetical protein DPEC_G00377920 [Dallia pectoralis]|nr:hypothetical protein DPEC_G00377920 [Dallia pectoralis]